jgi:hypothetical protein
MGIEMGAKTKESNALKWGQRNKSEFLKRGI